MASKELPDFTAPKLAQALQVMQTGGYATALPKLSAEEKALIYHYTLDGSDSIKNPLPGAAGLDARLRGYALANALYKLPPYVGPVYSAEWWEPAELNPSRLLNAIGLGFSPDVVRWPTFLSASTSRRVALEHLLHYPTRPKNCLLYILSKTGRYIDALSHRGINGTDPPVAEREVLFLPATQFQVVAVHQQTSYLEIELLEL